MKKSAFVLMLFTLLPPLPAKKAPPKPTQPDIIRGCVAVRAITFQSATFLHPLGVEMFGSVDNNCGKEVYVSIFASFFDGRGVEIDTGDIGQLVPSGETKFHVPADGCKNGMESGYTAVRYKAGRLTSVSVRSQP